MTDSKRTPKTPRQRAEEALGVAQRRVAKCEKRVTDTHTAWEEARRELADARRRLQYVADDPALPQDDPEPAAVPDGKEADAQLDTERGDHTGEGMQR